MSEKLTKEEKIFRKRHSTAHIMAEAVLQIFPDAKIAIGPAIDDGFYYDFDLPRKLKEEDLEDIENRMRDIINKGASFDKEVISREVALERFADQPYKVELINDLPEDAEISLYHSGDFVDLCKGPHVENSSQIDPRAIKLMSIAGAYWRGDSTRPMLQRIYGTVWNNAKELRFYLNKLEELKKRDHRKLGKELDLFHMVDENPGQIFWHDKGWSIYLTIQNYVRNRLSEQNYIEVHTPSVMPKSLWERSGHWAKYKENMFITESEKREFALKPMNCPGHVEIFKQGIKSYRDLPLRMAEFGSCTRNEASGALHGIMRVRGFVQDDAHIFCTEEQIADEVVLFVDLLKSMYKDFGFGDDNIIVKFSTRPEKRIGEDATWDRSEGALANACKVAGLEYEIAEGEGAFYGPKLEFTLVDALGRHWQCGTIQVDYLLPSNDRLNASYIGEDDNKHSPVMLHRAVLGSLERFIGILIEQYAGAFPVWLNPTQVMVIPVAQNFNEYAQKVTAQLKAAGIRVKLDDSDNRMNAKIRAAQNEKIPYMFILGEREESENQVSVRLRTGEQHQGMPLEESVNWVLGKINTKELI
ncbi:threonine--tRNA ligase [Spirochaeta cellobiosiphila]|uniref:threonine--tRNA ligase n=1 Tax=Spirochaeta cellobiosiphila TaxID=504483 RepID=UPI000402F91C|nr:threonine--tRNA ligase [Spirochaeta cellobiosiphila]